MNRWLNALLWILVLTFPLQSADLVVDGTNETITTETQIDGSIFVQNGGKLTIKNTNVTLMLDHDEEHHIDISGNSTLVIDNSVVRSEGGQFWMELSSDNTGDPLLEVKGASTWITNHSGIRPYDGSQVVVTGGDVEELQANDQAVVTLSGAAMYPVFFFDGVTANLQNLDTGTNITNQIQVPGGWSFQWTNANIEGYQIDLKHGANVTLDSGDGIVASVHTPGDLGDELRIVDGVTSPFPISGSITNLGSSFTFTDSNIALLNVYAFGDDRVLLRNLQANEINAQWGSQVIVGQKGYNTVLNCNLCQTYDHAELTVVEATIDGSENLPSATSSFGDLDPVGRGVMTFVNMDLTNLDLTVLEEGVLNLRNSPHDPARLSVEGPSAMVNQTALEADFLATRLTGAAPFAVDFLDMSAGNLDSYSWDFGDGSTSSLRDPSHTYSNPGLYSVSLTVTSGSANHQKTYQNLITVTGSSNCIPDATTMCLNGGRFRITVAWDTGVATGVGMAVPLTDDSGYFWFFNEANIEMVVKIRNACVNPFNHFWFFAGGLTNVATETTVTDTQTGSFKVYPTPQGPPFVPIQDTRAFATCP